MVRASFRQVTSFVSGAFRELPIETAAVLATAVSLMVAIQEVDAVPEIWLARVACAGPVVAALGFSLTLLARAGRLRRAAQLAVGTAMSAAVLVAIWFGLHDGDSEAFVWTYGASLLAALMIPFVTVALAAPRAARFDTFGSFLRRFLEQTQAWALLGVAAVAAVSIVFVALHGLFDLDVSRLGAQTALVITAAVALAWLYCLLPGSDDAQVPAMWRSLVTAIGAPFVAVMLVILAVYEVWALGRQELPRNILSPLVVTAGAAGFVCTLVMVAILRQPVDAPLAPAEPHRWARTRSVQIARAFPLVLLALLPMAFWALAIRIDDHGFTPMRVARFYGLTALALISLGGSVQYLRRRPPLSWQVPAVIAAVSLLAAFGPLSLVSISLGSQAARLDALLTEAGVSNRAVGAAVTPVVVDGERFDALYDRIRLLDDLGGETALRRVLTGDVAACSAQIYECVEKLGVMRANGDPESGWRSASVVASFQRGGDAIDAITLDERGPIVRGRVTLALAAAPDSAIEAREDGRVVGRASLADSLAELHGAGELTPRLLRFEGERGPGLGDVLVTSLSAHREGQVMRVSSLQAIWIRPAD